MKKEIRDYLHLYLGCECICEKSNYYLVHEKLIHNGEKLILTGWLVDYITTHFNIDVVFKPILYPLIGVDLKKINNWTSYEYWNDVPDDINSWFGARAKMIQQMLNEKIDLFGLIEDGLAIDKNVLP